MYNVQVPQSAILKIFPPRRRGWSLDAPVLEMVDGLVCEMAGEPAPQQRVVLAQNSLRLACAQHACTTNGK